MYSSQCKDWIRLYPACQETGSKLGGGGGGESVIWATEPNDISLKGDGERNSQYTHISDRHFPCQPEK